MQQQDREAWQAVLLGQSSMTWSTWGAGLHQSDRLTTEGKRVSAWALETFSEFFGADWLARTLAPGKGSPFMTLELWPENQAPGVPIRLFRLAAELQLLAGCGGFRRLKELMKRDSSAKTVRHLFVQLRVAALALRVGAKVDFESILQTKKVIDLVVDGAGRRFGIEVSVRGPDRSIHEYEERFDQVSGQVRSIGLQHDVGITSQVDAFDDPQAVSGWIRNIELASIATSSDGVRRSVVEPGVGMADVSVDREFSVRGPDLGGDQWASLSVRLRQKAEQTACGDAWIHLEEAGGLWYLTPWAQGTLRQKLSELETAWDQESEPMTHVEGLILSNSSLRPARADMEESVTGKSGSFALRRTLGDSTYRETFVLPNPRSKMHDAAPRIASWFQDEREWLDWALPRCGHPRLALLFEESRNAAAQS